MKINNERIGLAKSDDRALNRGEDSPKRLLPANCYTVDWAMSRTREEKNEMQKGRFDSHNHGGDDAA